MGKKVVIIGAVALGPKVASRLRRLDPDTEITMVDRDSIISYGGCGIPYYVGGDVQDSKELVSTVFHVRRDVEFFKIYKRVNVLTRTEATAIDRKAKTVRVKNLDTGTEEDLAYDQLVLATGASPFVPPLEGVDLPGVHIVANMHHAEAIKEKVAKGQVGSAIIVGGGAIGLEMAEAFTDLWGIETTVVEMLPQVMPMAVGPEIGRMVKKQFEDNDVRVIVGDRVTKVLGDENGVTGVQTDANGVIEGEMVIFSVGYRPNSQLAKDAGLAIGRFGGVLVDGTMRTSDPNIYAGGDCCEVRNLITGQFAYMPMGSLANRMGRVIGTNIAGGNDEFKGIVGTFCIKAFEMGMASTGLTEKQAKDAGFDAASVMVSGADRAHFYPTHSMMYIKLIADRKTRRVLGMEAIGKNGDAVKARVDAVAALLQYGATVEDVSNLEVAYSPPYASAMDVVNAAGNSMANVLDGYSEGLSMLDFAEGFKNEEFKVLDVRGKDNAVPYLEKFGAERWINIPQDELEGRMSEVPKEKMVVFCNTGLRSFECQRLLAQNGEMHPQAQGGHVLLMELCPDFLE